MIKSKGVVRFHVMESFSLRNKKKIKDDIFSLMAEEGKDFSSLDYILCSDEYLLDINKKFLQHDDLTDIITFNLAEQRGEIVGEIYISVERVNDNALLFNADPEDELRRVIFHGALHLCGYKDKSKAEQKTMRAREDYYLDKLSL